MASPSTNSPWMQRFTSFLEFLVAIFGALAIIGVFFKIQKYDNYEMYMVLGFMGEAAAFVIMGIFSLISGFWATSGEEAGTASAAGKGAVAVQNPSTPEAQELKASFRTMMEEKVNDDLNTMMGTLSDEVQYFGEEMHEMSAEMKRTRMALQEMSGELDAVAGGDLADDAERLGQGMNQLGNEMQGAGQAVGQMRSDLDTMATRFQQFNRPSGEQGARSGGSDSASNGVAAS